MSEDASHTRAARLEVKLVRIILALVPFLAFSIAVGASAWIDDTPEKENEKAPTREGVKPTPRTTP
jgi:hypothetical protein